MKDAPVAVVVEDEAQIRRFVRASLEEAGWQVFEADTVRRGLVEAGTRHPELVILDLGLADGSGLELLRDLRHWSKVHVIVLSARSHENDKIAALDAGADDFITKPFGAGELLARVRAAQRRASQAGARGSSMSRFGEVEIDLAARIVSRAGAEVHLTPIEYRLLAVLVANAGRVMTHQALLREVWGPARSDSAHYLRIFMSNLRQKLEVDPSRPQHLRTEVGVGYRLVLEQ